MLIIDCDSIVSINSLNKSKWVIIFEDVNDTKWISGLRNGLKVNSTTDFNNNLYDIEFYGTDNDPARCVTENFFNELYNVDACGNLIVDCEQYRGIQMGNTEVRLGDIWNCTLEDISPLP